MELPTSCTLCPRRCGVNRAAGQIGFCGAGVDAVVARAALHHWEEPCLSGEHGSGAVFFSHCTLRCVFCQNRQISWLGDGIPVSAEHLSRIYLNLQAQGAHNINLVTPTQFAVQIVSAVAMARMQGLTVPIVYNTSGYETADAIRQLAGTVDVFLTDFKYWDTAYAQRYSGAADYAVFARESLAQMVKQTGEAVLDEHGMMQKGVLVRHLMLPGHLEDSKKIIEYLYRTYGNTIFISIMNQYTPTDAVQSIPALNRTVRRKDYEDLIAFALELGLENGFVQEGGTARESFIPSFNGEGVMDV